MRASLRRGHQPLAAGHDRGLVGPGRQPGERGGPVLLLPEAPFALQVEVTSKCNLRCKMCPLTSGTTSSGASSGHIGAATWAQVLAAARRSRQVFISGFGEPLTNPACLQLLSDLDALAVRTTLVTNGAALSADIATRLAALENLVHVNVSIDSPDGGQYREIGAGASTGRCAAWAT